MVDSHKNIYMKYLKKKKKQFHRDRKYIRGYQVLGGGWNWELFLNGYRVSVWVDKNFQNL